MTKETILLNTRDVWEQRIKTARIQEEACRKSFDIFKVETQGIITRYKRFLERNNMEPKKTR